MSRGKLMPHGRLTVNVVMDTLRLIGEPVPDIEIVRSWSTKQRLYVYDWAIRTHLRASDNVILVPPKPRILCHAKSS